MIILHAPEIETASSVFPSKEEFFWFGIIPLGGWTWKIPFPSMSRHPECSNCVTAHWRDNWNDLRTWKLDLERGCSKFTALSVLQRTDPQIPLQRVLQTLRRSASCFIFLYLQYSMQHSTKLNTDGYVSIFLIYLIQQLLSPSFSSSLPLNLSLNNVIWQTILRMVWPSELYVRNVNTRLPFV
jgi:hypothetical protein